MERKEFPEEIGTVMEADDVLREIGLLESELEVIDAKARQKAETISQKAADDGAPARKRIAELTAKINAYAEANKGELFKEKKSIELVFGSFGFRESTSILVGENTVELLKKRGLLNCIRVKEEPNKTVLAQLDEKTLSKVGAERVTKDSFFLKAAPKKINGNILKKVS